LPAPPQIIEASLQELEDVPQNFVVDNIKEKSVDIPVSPPLEIKKIEIESPYFVAVEDMPEPVGGIASIQNKIVYPEIAKRAGVEGKVFVLAYVDETGNVTKAEITKGIGSGCDEAAMDAVLKTKFKPGVQRGNPVKVKITIPIVFKR
jgi:periplasmic protein TonB